MSHRGTLPRILSISLALLGLAGLSACGEDAPRGGDDAGVSPVDAFRDPSVDAATSEAKDASVATPDAYEPPNGETGRMVGMTAAHNRLRAMVGADPALPPLTWDPDLAAIAQAYSERLASTGCGLTHSSNGYGENLYWQRGLHVSAADVVESWYEEVACYTYGKFMRGDACDTACTDAMNASGCGHYTQVVWRNTERLGCGMATCSSGAEIWTCNYDPAGNYIGQYPY